VAAASTCLFCNTPFKPNSALASIPEAQRIAFDPDHRRVWRICHQCHEWNLLGAEAAADALPELQARFAVGIQGSALEGLDAAEVSDQLILLRVGMPSPTPTNQLFVSRRARHLFAQHRRAMLLIGFVFVWIVYELMTRTWSLDTIALALVLVGGIEWVQRAANRRAGAASGRGGEFICAAAVLVGTIGFLLSSPTWWPLIATAGVAGWLLPTRLAPQFAVQLQLDNAPLLLLSDEQVGVIRVGWDADTFELTLSNLPDGATWRGAHAEILLQVLLGRDNATQPRKVIDAGHRLAEQVGQAKGILRMLEGIRRGQPNRHRYLASRVSGGARHVARAGYLLPGRSRSFARAQG
jgi:hypothetical protein